MITLAFDSTAKIASCAILKDDEPLAVYHLNNGLTQSELLLPMAQNMLSQLKMSFDDVNVYACSAGPGSFTGVRIGVGLIKGLAFGKGLPCIGVSSIEALSENLRNLKGFVIPAMDARRGQFYCGIFHSDGNELVRLSDDMAISGEELAALLGERMKEYPTSVVYVVGDGYSGAKRALEKAGITTEQTPENLILQNAASVGKIAYRRVSEGNITADTDLKVTYLRLPQAERERLENLNKSKEV